MEPIFNQKSLDAAHWGITDLYPEQEKELKAALEKGNPFTTGWYSCKKEIQSACISYDGIKILLEVSVGMDDGPDLVDTALWEAAGGNDFAGCGEEAAQKLGIDFDSLVDECIDDGFLDEVCGIQHENYETGKIEIEFTQDIDKIYEKLSDLVDSLGNDLESRFQCLIHYIKEKIKEA